MSTVTASAPGAPGTPIPVPENHPSEAKRAPANRVGKGMWIQPLIVLVILAGYLVWLATADLSETERVTLAPSALWGSTLEHLELTLVSAVIVLVIGIPLGVLLTRRPLRRASGVILTLANAGQSAPAVGLIVLLAFWQGFTFKAAVIALVLYTILPILRNTIIGLDEVDPPLIEASRGMGMSGFATLWRVELPLATPVILSGVRTALVLLVGAAALAAFIGAGGLGVLIQTGMRLFLPSVLVSGALLSSLLALLIDWVGRIIETFVRPKGL